MGVLPLGRADVQRSLMIVFDVGWMLRYDSTNKQNRPGWCGVWSISSRIGPFLLGFDSPSGDAAYVRMEHTRTREKKRST